MQGNRCRRWWVKPAPLRRAALRWLCLATCAGAGWLQPARAGERSVWSGVVRVAGESAGREVVDAWQEEYAWLDRRLKAEHEKLKARREWRGDQERRPKCLLYAEDNPAPAEHMLDANALLWESDSTPADVVLRRTAALLARLHGMPGTGDLAAEAQRLETLRKRAAEGNEGIRVVKPCRLFDLDAPHTDWSGLLWHDGRVYAATSGWNVRDSGGAHLRLYDPHSGKAWDWQRTIPEWPGSGATHRGKRFPDLNYTSPSLAGGYIFDAIQTGRFAVIEPGPKRRVLAVNSTLDKPVTADYVTQQIIAGGDPWRPYGETYHSCPFFQGSRMYVRTKSHVICIGRSQDGASRAASEVAR